MKQIIIAAIVSITLVISSCGSGPSSSDPKATLTGFVKAIAQKDFKEARKYVTKESAAMLDIMESALAMAKTMKLEQADQQMDRFNDVTIGDAVIDGDHATVPVTDKTSGQTSEVPLIKQDGAWKVSFDPASMSGRKTNHGDQDMNIDSLRNVLRNINTDSLKMQMDAGMKQLDSLTKAMKQ